MGIIRPATPGFLTTLAATILLIVVSFCVPYFKSVYFLKASVTTSGVSGSITLGTLGYCLELPGNTTCSKASVGYQFDPNALLGNNTQIQIPQVVVKWLTYALVLHLVAMALAAISAVFGLLAHVREMSMSCFSSCVSGFAAGIALLAFIFDIVFFFVVKSRINKVQGGSAKIGNAIWLTLAAWVLLFFSGCVFAFGRCCISDRGPRANKQKHEEDGVGPYGGANPSNKYAETLRLDAVKAEADRKARQLAGTREVGLPAFQEYERQPLRSDPQYMEEELQSPYMDHAAQTAGHAVGDVRRQPSGYTTSSSRQPTSPGNGPYPGGYASGAPGGRAIDDFYDAAPAPGAQLAGIGAGGANAFAAHHQGPLGGEIGQGYPPQQHQYQDMHNNPYDNQPYGHAAAYDPYAPTGTYGNVAPVGQQQYPSYDRPAGPYAAPYGTPGIVPSQASYYTAQNTTPTPMGYDASGHPRQPADGNQSSYFPAQSPPAQQYRPHSQSPGHTSPSGPFGGLSPLHTSPSALPLSLAPGGVISPVSPRDRRRESMGSPQDPVGRTELVVHNWNSGRSDEEHTVLGEAPPQYNMFEGASSGHGHGNSEKR